MKANPSFKVESVKVESEKQWDTVFALARGSRACANCPQLSTLKLSRSPLPRSTRAALAILRSRTLALSTVLFFSLLLFSCSSLDSANPDSLTGHVWADQTSESSSSSDAKSSAITSSTVVSSSSTHTISYGTLTDFRDGQSYKKVVIGSQTWMAQNLAYLPSVNALASYSYTEAAYYVYSYDGSVVATAKASSNDSTYGVLYNYQAALTACPTDWHLPDTTEWSILETAVGGSATAAGKLRAVSSLWTTNSGITNTDDYGFSALPGGNFNGSSFSDVGNYGYWWTSVPSGTNNAFYRGIIYNNASMYHSYYNLYDAFSVRCLKD